MVIGMSRRDGRRKYKRRGKRKNQIFLVMMTILACTVTIVLTVKMNNQNVSKGVAVGAEYTAIKSDGNVTEEQLSVSEETVNDLPDVYRIECYESLNQNPELPTGCEITSLTSVLNYYGCNVDKTTMADVYLFFPAIYDAHSSPSCHDALCIACCTPLFIIFQFITSRARPLTFHDFSRSCPHKKGFPINSETLERTVLITITR